MRTIAAFGALLAVCLFAGASLAQEGYPLVGAWHGDWGFEGAARKDLTVIMDWDGKEISGLVNPVTDRARLIDARLDSGNWTVHFTADMKGDSGKTMRCVADGKLDHLGSDRRTLAGKWVCGGEAGSFKLTRDRDY